MPKILIVILAILLAGHGLIHMMGTVTYMRLGVIEGLTYKTTLLKGLWDLGTRGIAFFGALWAIAALGFIAAAIAVLFGWSWAQPVLLAVTLFSLALTAFDWDFAYAGAITNLVILAGIGLGPQITALFNR